MNFISYMHLLMRFSGEWDSKLFQTSPRNKCWDGGLKLQVLIPRFRISSGTIQVRYAFLFYFIQVRYVFIVKGTDSVTSVQEDWGGGRGGKAGSGGRVQRQDDGGTEGRMEVKKSGTKWEHLELLRLFSFFLSCKILDAKLFTFSFAFLLFFSLITWRDITKEEIRYFFFVFVFYCFYFVLE